MKTRVVEYHYVLSPVISRINGEIERDFIPMVARQKEVCILWIWWGCGRQEIAQQLNQYLHANCFGETLNYDRYWKDKFKKADKIKILT